MVYTITAGVKFTYTKVVMTQIKFGPTKSKVDHVYVCEQTCPLNLTRFLLQGRERQVAIKQCRSVDGKTSSGHCSRHARLVSSRGDNTARPPVGLTRVPRVVRDFSRPRNHVVDLLIVHLRRGSGTYMHAQVRVFPRPLMYCSCSVQDQTPHRRRSVARRNGSDYWSCPQYLFSSSQPARNTFPCPLGCVPILTREGNDDAA